MGLIPGYANDIFISYAHNDNRRAPNWVTKLHNELEPRLTELLGEPPVIWRDPRLEGTDLLDETLDNRVRDTAILLAVVSPSYFKSKWCEREREEFCRSAEMKGGLQVDKKFRIVKVVKTFVDRKEHPPELQKTLGYDFCYEDKDVKDYLEYRIPSSEYDFQIDKLARELKRLIEFLRNKHQGENASAETTIYLAEATADLEDEYKILRSEFTTRKYRVLPGEEFSRKLRATELEAQVREHLKACKLSIHLFGSSYGFIPDRGADRSFIHLQHDEAMKREREGDFKRVIWIPKGIEESEETEDRQKRFIDDLLKNSKELKNAEVSRGKIEDLKTLIHNLLKPTPDPIVKVKGNGSRGSIYFIYDRDESEETELIRQYLSNQKYEVMLSPHGTETEAAEYHRECLLFCDALLIYYDKVNDYWPQMKRLELLKLPGIGRSKPILAKAFYITGEPTPPKRKFESNEAIVIKQFGGFSPESLDPFILSINGIE